MFIIYNILKKLFSILLILNFVFVSPLVYAERSSAQRHSKKTEKPKLVTKEGAITTVHSFTGSARSYIEYAGAIRKAQKLIFARIKERHQIIMDFSKGISQMLSHKDFALNDITKETVNYTAPAALESYLRQVEQSRFKAQHKAILLDGISFNLSPFNNFRSVALSDDEIVPLEEESETDKKKKKNTGLWLALGGAVAGVGGLVLWNQCEKNAQKKHREELAKENADEKEALRTKVEAEAAEDKKEALSDFKKNEDGTYTGEKNGIKVTGTEEQILSLPDEGIVGNDNFIQSGDRIYYLDEDGKITKEGKVEDVLTNVGAAPDAWENHAGRKEIMQKNPEQWWKDSKPTDRYLYYKDKETNSWWSFEVNNKQTKVENAGNGPEPTIKNKTSPASTIRLPASKKDSGQRGSSGKNNGVYLNQDNFLVRSTASDRGMTSKLFGAGDGGAQMVCKIAADLLIVGGVTTIVLGVMKMLKDDKKDLKDANDMDKAINRNIQIAREHQDDSRGYGTGTGLDLGTGSAEDLASAKSDFSDRTGVDLSELNKALNAGGSELDNLGGSKADKKYLKSASSNAHTAALASNAYDKFGGAAGLEGASKTLQNSNAFSKHEKNKLKEDNLNIQQQVSQGGGGGGKSRGGGGGGTFNLNLAGLNPQLDAPIDKQFAPSNSFEPTSTRTISSNEVQAKGSLFERVGDRLRKLFRKGEDK